MPSSLATLTQGIHEAFGLRTSLRSLRIFFANFAVKGFRSRKQKAVTAKDAKKIRRDRKECLASGGLMDLHSLQQGGATLCVGRVRRDHSEWQATGRGAGHRSGGSDSSFSHLSGLPWKLFMSNAEIKPALDRIGFQPDLEDKASVNP